LPSKKNILILLLATVTCLIGMTALSRMERAWRLEIDRIIEKKLEAAGFQKFDGISYSYPISDEVLGVVQIYNQELFKRPDSNRAIINTRLGIINYQLNQLQSKLELNNISQHAMWQWTLGAPHSYDAGIFIEMFDLYRSQPLNEKEAAIDRLVAKISREVVPVFRKKFRTLADITKHLTEQKHRDEELYCVALAATGEMAKAKERADWNSANLKIARVHKIAWPEFKPKFDKWIADGAVVPNLAEARANTMKAAEERRKIISSTPKDERPTW
jgi:hypothetical protein